ncbi:SAM-dependent methyltransferase [Alcanivorax jadensis T9]|jgi:methionine biosynthesis protein MetW|uniref:SAM-dependent methyltransferase n=1 Tax=Alcanivorax jadensis T9 TaxID=1177181 RepID=A0ABR4WB46_9GAMM|nr:methionine biosynthesis protein MetW [Alcanivorax jadensis]KGD60608.1 SAM-dependent methyltransferase [Alcanivorax jadensis T9]MBG33103.1 methionine biosynthesis protein MetW [Alcanivorax sp.]MBP21908.1 methionine biosynthesis protein MetW [Alcanivorax sp.]MDF1635990.1 methionine biosynthesis protein MetW [Alcanivorax jadensis]|tara:strand:- start:1056 stop:1646 length:591 start_codon:yes stop_codon:yes gene_type:complete
MRDDLQLISDWIPADASLLDLGCGDGTLLAHLQHHKQIRGYGLEINQDNLAACFEKGVNVLEQDLDEGLGNFQNHRFDYVVMTQALQAVLRPDQILNEMLRVGREAIITFPNFGHWRVRAYLGLKGRMPVSSTLPYEWYNTPNIHLCTVQDFETHCRKSNIRILERQVINRRHRSGLLARLWPNLFGEIAIYRVTV